MYVASSKIDKVNTLRHELFLSKQGDVDSSMLPPCEDSLIQHIHRANYQVGVWRRALEPMPDVSPANGYGWVLTDDGALKIDWIQGLIAPDAVLELLACHCKWKCVPEDCPCLQNGLHCTYMCQLPTCENQKPQDVDETVEPDSDYSDVESDEEG